MIKRRPGLSQRIRFVDVRNAKRRVDAVPTILLHDGTVLVGGGAFQFVERFPEKTSGQERFLQVLAGFFLVWVAISYANSRP
jgi:hypothetical protein